MRSIMLVSLLLLSAPAQSNTHFADLASWQAAVGSHEIEDFESYPEMRLPIRGGSTQLDHFAIENDDQGANPWTGESGIYLGEDWADEFGGPRDTMQLVISTEDLGIAPDDEDFWANGPTYIDVVFPQRISAIGIETSWLEDSDETPGFTGFIFSEPTHRFTLASAEAGCNHSWCGVESIRWAVVVPEPTSSSLLLIGLIGLAGWRRGRA